MEKQKLGLFSTASIGIGGMIGGGIFAVTGLSIQLAKNEAPIAFVVAGIIALLVGYCYWKMTLAYPSEGGTIEFLNHGFGKGITAGSLNILLTFNYIVLLAIYAFALGTYAANLFEPENLGFYRHVFLTGAVVLLFLINAFTPKFVIESENLFNFSKLILLFLFVIIGLSIPFEFPENVSLAHSTVSDFDVFTGAMIIFLNYEGFELIANASNNIKNPKRTLPIAYLGGILFTILIYYFIVYVTLGHVSFADIGEHRDYVLTVAASSFMGKIGLIGIATAAILATASAINATFFASSKLVSDIVISKELPEELNKKVLHRPIEGLIIFAVLTLIVANFIPLHAIAVMGSAGFLIVFAAVSWSCFKKAKEIKASRIISFSATLLCVIAFISLCVKTVQSKETAYQIWILVGMISLAILIELYSRWKIKQVK